MTNAKIAARVHTGKSINNQQGSKAFINIEQKLSRLNL